MSYEGESTTEEGIQNENKIFLDYRCLRYFDFRVSDWFGAVSHRTPESSKGVSAEERSG